MLQKLSEHRFRPEGQIPKIGILKPAVSMIRAGRIVTTIGSGIVNVPVVIIIFVPRIVVGALVIPVFVVVCCVKPGSFNKSDGETFSLRFDWRRNKHSQ